MLRYCGENVHCEPIRFRKVTRDEINTRFHKGADEVHIAGEPIQLCDYQRRLMQAAEPQRFRNLGTVVPFTTFYLDHLLYKRPVSAVQVSADGLTLRPPALNHLRPAVPSRLLGTR